jgi:polysaccharide export outer membrane protein
MIEPLRRPQFVIISLLATVLIGCAIKTPPPTAPNPQAEPGARQKMMTIVPGDVLEVIIRRGAGQESYTATVRDNGLLSVSFVDVDVKGLTALEAEEKLVEVLKPYVKEPRAQVLFKQKVVTDRIFVFGEVNKPGVFALEPGMTVVDALGKAAGYSKDAYLPSLRVLRGGLDDPQVLPVDLDQLLHNGQLTQNMLLKNQDIVYVPRSRIGDWNAFMKNLIPTLDVMSKALEPIILYQTIADK